MAGDVGWPYETTAAMIRLVHSGIMEKYPNLKVLSPFTIAVAWPILCGANKRIAQINGAHGQPEANVNCIKMLLIISKCSLLIRRFTATLPALMCGFAFFGPEHRFWG